MAGLSPGPSYIPTGVHGWSVYQGVHRVGIYRVYPGRHIYREAYNQGIPLGRRRDLCAEATSLLRKDGKRPLRRGYQPP